MKGKNVDILVLGNLSIDEIGTTEFITDSHYSTQVSKIQRFFGGRGANFVVFSKLFGMKSLLVAYAGRDRDGYDYMKHLQKMGIDTSGIYYAGESGTTKAFVFKDIKKTRIFFYDAINPRDAGFREHARRTLESVKNYKAMYCTSQLARLNMMFLSSRKPSPESMKVFAPGHNLYLYSREEIDACLQNTDMLILNEYEYSVMRRYYKSGMAPMASKFGIENVVITLGARGLVLLHGGSKVYVPAFRARRVIDPNGAGDSFAAAFVSNYTKTRDLVKSAKIASSTASFVVEELGCQEKIPTVSEIGSRMEKNVIIKSNINDIMRYVK